MAQRIKNDDDDFIIIDVNENFDLTDRANKLLLNLLNGFNPNKLNEEEIKCLQKRFGINILNQFKN